jgi:hypothetical protein
MFWMGALGLLALGAACEVEGKSAEKPTAEGSGGAGAGGAATAPSKPGARPPERPTVEVPGGGKTLAFLSHRYFLGAVDPETGETDLLAWRKMGYDFDGVTTTPELAASDTPGTCQRQTGSRLTSLVDGEDGRDNNWGSELLRIYGNLANGPDTLERDINAQADGFGISQAFVVVIEDLADGPEDQEVRIGFLFTAHQDIAPVFDGTDRFLIDSRSVKPGTIEPRFFFSRGYMTGNTVVSGDFREPTGEPLHFPLGTAGVLPLALRAMTMTFELDPEHKKVLSSTMAGVLPLGDLVKLLSSIFSNQGAWECGAEGEKKLFTLLRPAADLSADLPGFLDPTGQTLCDAISFGWRLTWKPIAVPRLEDVVVQPPLQSKCPAQDSP